MLKRNSFAALLEKGFSSVKTFKPSKISQSKVSNNITTKFWLKEYLMWLQLKFALCRLSTIQKFKQSKARMSKERGEEGGKMLLTFLTDTLQVQVSRIPVVALALILHIKKNFFFQRTQFACTTSLQVDSICSVLDAHTFRTVHCNKTAQKQTLVPFFVQWPLHANSGPRPE